MERASVIASAEGRSGRLIGSIGCQFFKQDEQRRRLADLRYRNDQVPVLRHMPRMRAWRSMGAATDCSAVRVTTGQVIASNTSMMADGMNRVRDANT